MAWEVNGTPDTLTVSNASTSIPDMIAKKFNVIMSYIDKSVDVAVNQRYNGNGNTVYARRRSANGGIDALTPSTTAIDWTSLGTVPMFGVYYTVSISVEEKLSIGFTVNQGNAGAGSSPDRSETVAKFVPSPDVDITATSITLSSGQQVGGSNLSAFGTD
jgi:hypothetical protein